MNSTSAKEKARYFVEIFSGEDWDECDIENKLGSLLNKHERDTRYKAIEVLQGLEVK